MMVGSDCLQPSAEVGVPIIASQHMHSALAWMLSSLALVVFEAVL